MARLIDTSVFIELERRGQSVDALGQALRGDSDALASITASELLVGVHRVITPAQRLRRQAFVEGVLQRIPTIPFDLDVVRVHARLAADLATAGQSIGANDLLIAATALAYGYAVLTQNLRHFQRVPGLAVSQPVW